MFNEELTAEFNRIAEEFHAEFDRIARELFEVARDAMVENSLPPTRDTIIAQLLMNWLGDDEMVNKRAAFNVAEYAGPDWSQALYHTAVFMTKVA